MILLAARILLGGCLLIICRWLYRLTFHPLAGVPGPRLAAMTSAYAMFWDLSKDASYIKNFAKWHEKYGPIIRIEPNHVHILDVDSYNQVFKIGTKFYRDPQIYSFPYTKGGFFNKLHVKEAKPHRDLYMHYFSRTNVSKLEPVIRQNLGQFLCRIDEATTVDGAVDVKRGARSWTADTIMRYMYDQDFGAVNHPNFSHPMLECMDDYFRNAPLGWYFPRLVCTVADWMGRIPRHWVKDEGIASSLAILDSSERNITALQAQPADERTMSIFETALNPNVEKGQPALNVKSLAADALAFFTAGTDTTANALVTGTWHLLNDRAALKAFQDELRAAIPHSTDLRDMPLDWATLENLKQLRCVVKESLRLSYGVPGKIPRIVPPEGTSLVGHHLPGGTALSMACHVYHHHSSFFEDPDDFKPARWSDPEKAAELEKYFITFSRGSRNCIGQNLAYAELYYAFAYLFRRFDLEAFETTSTDMEWKDAFVVVTNGHLKVKGRKTQA